MAAVGSPFENACILTGVGVAAILINSAIITKWGRRRVFLTTGMALCGITQLIVAIVYDKKGPSTSTGKVSPGRSVRDQVVLLTPIFSRSSSVSQSSTSWPTTAWWRRTRGSAAASSPRSVFAATPSAWRLRSASWAPGSPPSPPRTLSTRTR